MMTGLVFLGLNILLAASAFFFVVHVWNYQVRDVGKLILASFLAFVVEIVLLEISLGMFDAISYLHMAVGIVLIFMSLGILFWKNYSHIKIEKKLACKPPFIFWMLFLPVGFLLLVRAGNALVQIPLEYDSVAYHLPFAVEWLKTGSLRDLYYSAFAGPISFYPSTYELLDLWVMLPLRNDVLVNLLNFPLFVIFGLAVYRVARNFSVNRRISLVATALIFYMPVFLRQAGVALVDLFFSLTFTLSIYFLQEVWKARQEGRSALSDTFFFGLSIGLFIGTKYLGLIMAPPLLILWLFIVFSGPHAAHSEKRTKEFFLGIFAILIVGSFFYLRNWVVSGNPLFPIDVRLGSWTLFGGYRGEVLKNQLFSTSLMANFTTPGVWNEFLKKYFFMVGWPSIMMIAAGAVTILHSLVIKKDRAVGLLLSLGMIFYVFLYVSSPYSYKDLLSNVRYSMPLLVVGALTTAFAASRIRIIRKIFFLAASVSLVYAFFFLLLMPSAGLHPPERFFVDFSYAIPPKSFITQREKLIPYFSDEWYEQEPGLRGIIDAALWLDQNAPHADIAYSGFNFHYHLFGRDLSRDVAYININDCANCRYQDFKREPESIRTHPNEAAWLKNLREKKRQFLVVAPHFMPVRSFEFEWAQANPHIFRKVFEKNGVYMYAIFYDA